MRVLVTGGAGYVGSHLVEALLRQGHEVWCVDNLSTGQAINIAHLAAEPCFHFVQDSILNESLMQRLMERIECVYHLAAVVGVAHVLRDPAGCIRTNVRGTEVVLEEAYRNGVRTVIVSSSEVYGKSTALPLAEDDDSVFGSTTKPRWCYAMAKAIDEHLALHYARRGLAVCVVRYFNSYGPRLDPQGYGSVVARLIVQALRGEPMTVFGDGQQTRSFTYVDDTVLGTILAGTMPRAVGQIINIGSDRETSVSELAMMIRTLSGSGSEIVHVPYEEAYGQDFEEARRRVPDVRRAAEMLGFRARTPLEEGLLRTIAWFRAEGFGQET